MTVHASFVTSYIVRLELSGADNIPVVGNVLFCECHFAIPISFITEGKETLHDLENTYVLLYL